MTEAASREEWDKTADLSHKIQPPCRHIGAARLFDLLYETEQSIRKESNTGRIGIMIENSLAEFGIIKQLVEEEIAKIS